MKCLVCGTEFDTSKPNRKYCSYKCRREAEKIRYRKKTPRKIPAEKLNKCVLCGNEFTTVDSKKKYCSDKCRAQAYFIRANYYSFKVKEKTAKPKILKPTKPQAEKKTGKTLSDWAREAQECNLDYGTYRALIACGKTFEQLKATAKNRIAKGHSNTHLHTR